MNKKLSKFIKDFYPFLMLVLFYYSGKLFFNFSENESALLAIILLIGFYLKKEIGKSKKIRQDLDDIEKELEEKGVIY